MKTNGHVIKAVDPGSIAEALELAPGDRVLAINGREIEDIFDYQYQVNSKQLVMLVEKTDGDQWELEIENDYQDLGITFENGLMSDYRSCTNKCIFCFIDQMPPGMRETLYFKDDDSRLSFLQGNYVTLTNMKDHDIWTGSLIIKLSPINVSVHTTEPGAALHDAPQPVRGQALEQLDTAVRGRDPDERPDCSVQGYQRRGGAGPDHRGSGQIPCPDGERVRGSGGTFQIPGGLYPLEPFDKADGGAAP